MNIKHLAAVAVTTAIVAVSTGVQAQTQTAVTARTTNLRAGPATDYPVVAVLPAGFALAVQGCLPEYTWCDVVAGQSRGWMAAGNINYYYQHSYVPLSNYGAVLGIGALAFVLNDYWGSHYRDRPFYRDRHRWDNRRFAEPRHYAPPQRHDYSPPAYSQPGYSGPRYAPGGSTPIPRAQRAPRDEAPGGSTPIARPNRPQREAAPGGSPIVPPAATTPRSNPPGGQNPPDQTY